MRIGHISNLLVSLYNNTATRNRALFLVGASGIGKSQVVYQAAQALDIPVIDLRLAQCDPVDLRGVPTVEKHKTVWNPPDFFPDADTNPVGILFLDEITSAPPAIQAVAYQLILDRAVGSYKLPDGWMVVTAGNRANDRGVTFAMAAPLLNRMTEIVVDTTLDDWIDHAATNNIRPEVMAFLKGRADFLHKFDKDSYGKQFPSPRGWFAASNVLDMALDAATRVELLQGTVGHEAAVNFEAFMKIWETMPSLDAIFADPDSIDIPRELNVRYCVAMGVSARLDKKNFATAWKYITRMPKEFQTLIVKLGYQRDKTLIQSPAFAEWATANSDAFKRS